MKTVCLKTLLHTCELTEYLFICMYICIFNLSQSNLNILWIYKLNIMKVLCVYMFALACYTIGMFFKLKFKVSFGKWTVFLNLCLERSPCRIRQRTTHTTSSLHVLWYNTSTYYSKSLFQFCCPVFSTFIVSVRSAFFICPSARWTNFVMSLATAGRVLPPTRATASTNRSRL